MKKIIVLALCASSILQTISATEFSDTFNQYRLLEQATLNVPKKQIPNTRYSNTSDITTSSLAGGLGPESLNSRNSMIEPHSSVPLLNPAATGGYTNNRDSNMLNDTAQFLFNKDARPSHLTDNPMIPPKTIGKSCCEILQRMFCCFKVNEAGPMNEKKHTSMDIDDSIIDNENHSKSHSLNCSNRKEEKTQIDFIDRIGIDFDNRASSSPSSPPSPPPSSSFKSLPSNNAIKTNDICIGLLSGQKSEIKASSLQEDSFWNPLDNFSYKSSVL
jgi:hypothetical protein